MHGGWGVVRDGAGMWGMGCGGGKELMGWGWVWGVVGSY